MPDSTQIVGGKSPHNAKNILLIGVYGIKCTLIWLHIMSLDA